MKFFLVSIFALSIQLSSNLARADHGRIYDQPWESLTCHEVYIQEADDFIRYYQARINSAENYKERCGGGNSGTCVRYLMDKGYGPSTAKETCNGLNDLEFRCLQYFMEKGYGPSTGKETCSGIPFESTLTCMKDMVSRGYGPSTARQTCMN